MATSGTLTLTSSSERASTPGNHTHTDLLFFRQALDELGLKRYCCRRMILTHVDLISKLLNYNIYENERD